MSLPLMRLGKVGRFMRVSDSGLTYTSTITGLRAAWMMDETSGTVVGDSSSNGYNSSSLNGTSIVAGKFGNARSFASGDYIQFSASPLPDPGAFSLAFWCKTSFPSSGGYMFLGRMAQSGGQMFISLSNTSGTYYIAVCFRNNSQFRYSLTAGSPVVGGWNFFVLTYSGAGKGTQSAFVHYLNNVALSFAANDGTAGGSINDTQIGTDNGGSNNIGLFVGQMDSYMVFNKVLSTTEIAALYTASIMAVDSTANTVSTA